LVKHYNISVFAVRGGSNETYYKHINAVLDIKSQITMDDGADLVMTVLLRRRDLLEGYYRRDGRNYSRCC
jgi:adenosylhomocysteinase